MSIFDSIKKVFRFHPSQPEYWAQKFFGGGIESKSGVRVDEDTAMKYSAYARGIRLISETIASLPLNIYEDVGAKGKIKASKHPLQLLLHDAPNEDMDSFTWRETAKVHVLGWGNHYSLLKRNPLKRYVEELYPMEPWRIKPEMVNTPSFGKVKVYRYQPIEGPEIVLNKDNVLHIHGLSYNGLVGVSPLTWYREQIGLGLAMEEYSSRFFSNGLNAGGIFSTPQVLKKETYDKLKKELQEKYSGLGKSHSTMVLEQDVKFDKLSINPNDAQLLESKKFQVEEIARILGIPLSFFQTSDPISDNNIEHLGINFVVYCLRAWLVRDEQAYNMQLFTENEKGKYFTKYVVDGLLRGDTAARWEAYTKGFNTGALSPNDILEMEDKNPYEGGEKHFIQLNMQPVEDIGKLLNNSQSSNLVRAIESRNLNQILIERLQKAYKPMFVNALIRILKREKTDVLKIIKDKCTGKDIEDYYIKHSLFVNSQIKPAIYAFLEALGAETDLKESDITIFAIEISQDFVSRYIENNLKELKVDGKFPIDNFETIFNEWLENKPEELSSIEIARISTAFSKYIQRIGL